jgi:hypothetical protein
LTLMLAACLRVVRCSTSWGSLLRWRVANSAPKATATNAAAGLELTDDTSCPIHRRLLPSALVMSRSWMTAKVMAPGSAGRIFSTTAAWIAASPLRAIAVYRHPELDDLALQDRDHLFDRPAQKNCHRSR